MKKSLYVILTEECNLRCKYCFYDSESRNKDQLDYNKVINSIKASKDRINRVFLTGGEPMIYKNLKNIISYLFENKLEINLLTNASLLKNEDINFFISNNVKLHVSLDSINPDYSIRSSKFINNDIFNNLSKYPSDLVTINITLNKKNFKTIPELIKYIKEKSWNYNLNFVESDDKDTSIYELDSTLHDDMLKIVSQFRSKNRSKIVNRLIEQKKNFIKECPFKKNSIVVNYNGDITSCFRSKKIGNIYSENFNNVIKKIDNKDISCNNLSLKCLSLLF